VYDNGRYGVYSLDGVLHRQFQLAGPTPRDRAYRTACNAQGILLSYAWDLLKDLPHQSGITRTVVPYWFSNADGTLLTMLGRFPSSERWATVTDTVSGTSPLPLGKQPVVAVGRTRAYIGLADSFAIDVFSLDGQRTGSIRYDQPIRQTSAADIERFKLLDTIGRSEIDNIRQVQEWKTMQFSPTLPAYSAMVVDTDDNVWVKIFPSANDSRATWLGFSPSRARIGQLTLPINLDVHEIGRDYVLGTETETRTGIKRVKSFDMVRPDH
jgi:hypothetical protein